MPLALSPARPPSAARRHGVVARRSSRWRYLGIAGLAIFWLLGMTLLVGAISFVVWFGGFAGELPSPDQLTSRSPFQTTRVLANDGSTLLFEITDPQGGRRTVIPLSEVPRTVIEASVAAEDGSFFTNPGFELRSILRAGVDDVSSQSVVSGASTITQQVVRNVLLTPAERVDLSLGRKIKEIILAYQLTQTYTKDQILQVYLNEIFYGNRSYGIEAAAEGYFGKPASTLDLAESALLAGLPQAPSYFDPYHDLQPVKERQAYVLQRMVDQGYITVEEGQQALDEPLNVVDRPQTLVAPHFVSYVSDVLSAQLGQAQLYDGGYQVVTTLDNQLQGFAAQTLTANLKNLQAAHADNAALVVLDPQTGHVLAMVGSANYNDPKISGEINMAIVPRDSGGILSPLTYALALGHGDTLATKLDGDVAPTTKTSPGANQPPQISLRQALGLGSDSAGTQVMGQIGGQTLVGLLQQLGIPNVNQRIIYTRDLNVAGARVSPLEVAQVYALFANGGVSHQPSSLARITQPDGTNVPVVVPPPLAAFDPGIAYLITNVLTDQALRPTASKPVSDLGMPIAFHQSVSDGNQDVWAAGYVPNLTVVVWVGNSQGGAVADPSVGSRIWSEFVKGALTKYRPTAFVAPSDVTTVDLCQNLGCATTQSELVLKGTEAAALATNAPFLTQKSQPSGNNQTPLVNRFAATPSTAAPASKPATNQAPGAVPTHVPAVATAKPASITVPDVSGLTSNEARARLGAAGFIVAANPTLQPGATLPASEKQFGVGQVVATIPSAGQTANAGSTIVLTVRRD